MKKIALLLTITSALLLGIQTASAQKSESKGPGTNVVQATWGSYKAETLEGTLSMVVAEQKLVVVTSSEGVPYDFVVTKKTKIDIGGTPSSFDELSGQTHRQATVTFLPRRNGNMAQSISVSE